MAGRKTWPATDQRRLASATVTLHSLSYLRGNMTFRGPIQSCLIPTMTLYPRTALQHPLYYQLPPLNDLLLPCAGRSNAPDHLTSCRMSASAVRL